MPGDKKFELGDYVEVKDRIAIFYELYPQGRLVTTKVQQKLGPDGVPRVIVQAAAYRSPDDSLPGTGHSWMALPGTTPYTRGSELENTETSAWGRAIASLGILIDRSIASGQEVQNKQGQEPKQDGGVIQTSDHPVATADGSLIGEAITQGASDYEMRQTPTGWVLQFRLKNGRSSFIVRAEDAAATAVKGLGIIGQRVEVWGHWTEEEFVKAGKSLRFKVLHLDRIKTPDGEFPAPGIDEPPEDLPLVGEAETVPLDL
jgi:hypothetical protein